MKLKHEWKPYNKYNNGFDYYKCSTCNLVKAVGEISVFYLLNTGIDHNYKHYKFIECSEFIMKQILE